MAGVVRTSHSSLQKSSSLNRPNPLATYLLVHVGNCRHSNHQCLHRKGQVVHILRTYTSQGRPNQPNMAYPSVEPRKIAFDHTRMAVAARYMLNSVDLNRESSHAGHFKIFQISQFLESRGCDTWNESITFH
jgi:hypothetical protein